MGMAIYRVKQVTYPDLLVGFYLFIYLLSWFWGGWVEAGNLYNVTQVRGGFEFGSRHPALFIAVDIF